MGWGDTKPQPVAHSGDRTTGRRSRATKRSLRLEIVHTWAVGHWDTDMEQDTTGVQDSQPHNNTVTLHLPSVWAHQGLHSHKTDYFCVPHSKLRMFHQEDSLG